VRGNEIGGFERGGGVECGRGGELVGGNKKKTMNAVKIREKRDGEEDGIWGPQELRFLKRDSLGGHDSHKLKLDTAVLGQKNNDKGVRERNRHSAERRGASGSFRRRMSRLNMREKGKFRSDSKKTKCSQNKCTVATQTMKRDSFKKKKKKKKKKNQKKKKKTKNR